MILLNGNFKCLGNNVILPKAKERDIEEFLETLYNNTELEEERTTIHSMLENLLEAL